MLFRSIMGVAKPPILLSKDRNSMISRNETSPSRINNTNTLAGVSSFKTLSMIGGAAGPQPYRSVSIF